MKVKILLNGTMREAEISSLSASDRSRQRSWLLQCETWM